MSKITQSFTKPITTKEAIRAEIQEKIAVLELGSQVEQLSRINDVCDGYQKLLELDQGLYYGELLLSKATKWRNAYYIGLANYNIGYCYMYTAGLGWGKAIPYYKKSLTIFQQGHLESPISLVNVYINIAWSYSRLGDYETALRYYLDLKALHEVNIHQLENQVHTIEVLTKIGRVYVLLKDYEKGLQVFKEAEKMMNTPSIKPHVPIDYQFSVWNGLGNTYSNIGEYALAIDCFTQFGKLASQTPLYGKLALCLYNISLGGVYLDSQEPNKALHYYQEALKYSGNKSSYFYTTMLNIGLCYFELCDYQKSLSCYEEILKGCENISRNNLIELYRAMHKTYLALEKYKLAYEFLQKHTELKEETMGAKTRFAIAKLEKQIEGEREEKERVAAEIKALRAQINPHFIFNTLNSIQNYIAQNQSEDAQRFLASFASLMRQTLESSDESLVAVEDEVYFIHTYLTLEQLRFEQKFDFSINIEESVDIEALLMPPMLLQPYFENAILHGIQPKEDKGLILLELVEEEECLSFTITDNGIGRSAAAIQKKKHKSQHKSMGTQIQADRLKALNSFYKRPIEVQTTDIINELGKVCGTKVELKVPIWEM